MTEEQTFSFDVEDHESGQRLDKFLSMRCVEVSRSRLKNLVLEGQVTIDDADAITPSVKIKNGQTIEVIIPPAEEYKLEAQNIPLDVIYEDEDLLVINKSAKMVVHPAAGNWDGTLVHALLYHCGDTLSGINGVMRPGIVHRLDKETSGLMMVAKNDHAHKHLSAQLADRSLSRKYTALLSGHIQPLMGKIDLPMGRHPRDRIRIAIRQEGGKNAVTHYKLIKYFGEALSLVECKLETGRTHQIRVHMQAMNTPLIGDPLYGEQPTKTRSLMKKDKYDPDLIEQVINFPRQALHAHEISFVHPRTEKIVKLVSELPDDMMEIINLLK